MGSRTRSLLKAEVGEGRERNRSQRQTSDTNTYVELTVLGSRRISLPVELPPGREGFQGADAFTFGRGMLDWTLSSPGLFCLGGGVRVRLQRTLHPALLLPSAGVDGENPSTSNSLSKHSLPCSLDSLTLLEKPSTTLNTPSLEPKLTSPLPRPRRHRRRHPRPRPLCNPLHLRSRSKRCHGDRHGRHSRPRYSSPVSRGAEEGGRGQGGEGEEVPWSAEGGDRVGGREEGVEQVVGEGFGESGEGLFGQWVSLRSVGDLGSLGGADESCSNTIAAVAGIPSDANSLVSYARNAAQVSHSVVVRE